MRQATCHSHRGTSLTHSIQQTIRSMSTDAVFPPCNTNYLRILYCQVLHALFMQATISETVNKKDGGVTLDGRELPGSERWSLMKLDCIRSKSKPEAQWWARICDSPSSKLGIFHGTCCSCEFLKSSLCEVPKYFVLWHQFPRSATVVGLYITSARTIKLL